MRASSKFTEHVASLDVQWFLAANADKRVNVGRNIEGIVSIYIQPVGSSSRKAITLTDRYQARRDTYGLSTEPVGQYSSS